MAGGIEDPERRSSDSGHEHDETNSNRDSDEQHMLINSSDSDNEKQTNIDAALSSPGGKQPSKLLLKHPQQPGPAQLAWDEPTSSSTDPILTPDTVMPTDQAPGNPLSNEPTVRHQSPAQTPLLKKKKKKTKKKKKKKKKHAHFHSRTHSLTCPSPLPFPPSPSNPARYPVGSHWHHWLWMAAAACAFDLWALLLHRQHWSVPFRPLFSLARCANFFLFLFFFSLTVLTPFLPCTSCPPNLNTCAQCTTRNA